MNSVDAKQFLIARVIEEADLEKVRLSDIERKMLYFTEAYPSLPDIYEINAEFERNYDADEYEDKVATLFKNARDRDGRTSPSREQEWKDALDALKKEDHYILVMVRQAFRAGSDARTESHFRDFLIYVAIGVALVLALVLISMWRAGH
ncbi:MAG: hypothetical protein WAM13_05980 [Candidatus Sulfotelmatobacter sp.]